VMCQIVQSEGGSNTQGLSDDQRHMAKQLFHVGGVSFNDQRDSKEASRRVEFKLEFVGLDETEQVRETVSSAQSFQGKEECQI
jgi:hypothetical protein